MGANLQPPFINGYTYLNESYNNSLDQIVGSLSAITPQPPTIENLNSVLVEVIEKQYFNLAKPSFDQSQQLNSILGNIFNAYVGPQNPLVINNFSDKQIFIIRQIISGIGYNCMNNPNSAENYFVLIQENIATSGLTTTEQAPLLQAVAIAYVTYQYFYSQIISPSTEWANYINSNSAINFINFPRWIQVAFKGALIGSTQSIQVTPTTSIQGIGVGYNLITTYAGGLATTFGEIIFGWVERPIQGL